MTALTGAEAAWIREQVWTKAMRKTFTEVPGHYLACACQYGPTGHCRAGGHRNCRAAKPQPHQETYVCGRDGRVLYNADFYEHPTLTATGGHLQRAAYVWLADRICRWRCPCDCHAGGAQLELFDLAVAS